MNGKKQYAGNALDGSNLIYHEFACAQCMQSGKCIAVVLYILLS